MTTAVSLLSLPNEIVEVIVDLLASRDNGLLKTCSIVSHRLTHFAQKHLFHTITLRPEDISKSSSERVKHGDCGAFLSFIDNPCHRHIGLLVKHLSILESGNAQTESNSLGFGFQSLPRILDLLPNIEQLGIPFTFLQLIDSPSLCAHDWKSSLIYALQRPALREIQISQGLNSSQEFFLPFKPTLDLLLHSVQYLQLKHLGIVAVGPTAKCHFQVQPSMMSGGCLDLIALEIEALRFDIVDDFIMTVATPSDFPVNISNLQTLKISLGVKHKRTVQMFGTWPGANAIIQGSLLPFKNVVQNLHLQYSDVAFLFRPNDDVVNLGTCTNLKTLTLRCIIHHSAGSAYAAQSEDFLLRLAKSVKTLLRPCLLEKVTLDFEHHMYGGADAPFSDCNAWKILDEYFSDYNSFDSLCELKIVQIFTRGFFFSPARMEASVRGLFRLTDKRGILNVEATAEFM